MLAKPRSITNIGLVQVLLAATFVVWLLFVPDRGDNFAWPVTPRLTAMFIGASFVARTYLGYFLWREKEWWRLRWQVWGNLGFLTVIFLATYWHIDEMNWTSNIILAHIWVLAYTIEPLMLVVLEPRGPEAKAGPPPERREGPLQPGLKFVLLVAFISGITFTALLFINPQFASTRWPWPLDPFNARVMAAFAALGGLWALQAYLMDDWAEAKLGVLGITIYMAVLFVVWVITVGQYPADQPNGTTYGVVTGLFTLVLLYFYWRQERARSG